MRVPWIVSILTTVVSMALLVIIMGQYQVSPMLKKGVVKLQMKSEKLENQHIDECLFKATVEKLLAQGQKAVEDLEATVPKLVGEMEKKKTENEACQAEKKTKADELAGTEKEHAETTAALKVEADAWTEEMKTLRAQLTMYRPICDHVKKDTLAVKLCGNKTAGALF